MEITAPVKAETARYAAAKSRRKVMQRVGIITLQVLITLFLLTFLGPTLWMVSLSLENAARYLRDADCMD